MASIKKQQKAAQAKNKAAANQRKARAAAAAKAAAEKAKSGYNEQLSTLSPQQQSLQDQLIQQARGQVGGLQPYNPQGNQPQQPEVQVPGQEQPQEPQSYYDYIKNAASSAASGIGNAASGLGSYLTSDNPIAAAGSPLDKLYNHLTQNDYSKSGYQGPTNSGLGSLAGGLVDTAQQYLPDALKPYASSLAGLANPSGPRDYSDPGFLNDLYNYATQTDYGKDTLTPQEVNQGFQPYEAQMRQGFNEGTVPGLAERFTSLGGGRLGSPTFAQQLGQAGRGLEGDINAARETYRQGQQQYNLGNRQVGLQQRQYNKANDISNRQIGLSQENQRQNFDLGNRQLGLNQEGQRFNNTLALQNRDTQRDQFAQQLGQNQNQFAQQLGQNQNQFEKNYGLQQGEQNRINQGQTFNQAYDLSRLAVNPNVENLYHAPQQSYGKQLGLAALGAGGQALAGYAGRAR